MRTRHLVLALGACLALAARGGAQSEECRVLVGEAVSLPLRYAGKSTTGGKIDTKLRPVVRGAINEWAAVARQLGLEVVAPQKADGLVIGKAPLQDLLDAASWMDKAAVLFEGLPPVEGAPAAHPIIVALFDDAGFQTPAWPGLMDVLLARKALPADFAERMKSSPGSFTLRNASFFAQHTYDMAGNVAEGDDEFRFGNEIVHKTAQYLLEARYGRQPDVLRWGVGYVAEQRIFGNVYQFNRDGFVGSADHFGWPDKTRTVLADRMKKDGFSLADEVLRTQRPGTADFGQLCTWGLLDYQLAKDPQGLATLLGKLGSLHRTGDPMAVGIEYRGDAQQTRDAYEEAWSKLKPSALVGYLKTLK